MTNIENRDPAEPAGPTATTKSEQRSPKRGAQQKRGAPKRRHQPTTRTPQGARHKAARAAKTAAKPVGGGRGRTPRAESKGANVLRLISRPKGATLAEIRQATGWQAHSVRGFLSTAAKKHGWKIESATNEAHDRVYQVKNGARDPHGHSTEVRRLPIWRPSPLSAEKQKHEKLRNARSRVSSSGVRHGN